MRKLFNCILVILLLCSSSSLSEAGIATFDDLLTPPASDGSQGLFFANNNSSTYQQVVWDSRVTVFGNAYRVDTVSPGPLFGIPRSGQYAITNEGAAGANDGILLTTTQVLTGAWFGRNEYYGFGAGADQVTIHALNGNTILDSVVFNLAPPTMPGTPSDLAFVDTSSFTNLVGITGYRIDRNELTPLSGNWVADDLSFIDPVAVPEPCSFSLFASSLVFWVHKAKGKRKTLLS